MTKTNEAIEFNIDFGGFYESLHSYILDNAIAYRFDADDIEEVKEAEIDTVNYKAMQEEYGSQWLAMFNAHFNQAFKFAGIDSPRYYNFETDKIAASASVALVDDLISINCDDADFHEWLAVESASRDGFNSFYSGFWQVIKNKQVFMNYLTRYWLEMDEAIGGEVAGWYEDIQLEAITK